ncbi:hypothetical protein EMIT0P44_120097 [Pseudomonas sp. IT-P44]
MSGENQKRTPIPVGAGLPAMAVAVAVAVAVGQSTHLSPERTPSPASWLLQGKCICVVG